MEEQLIVKLAESGILGILLAISLLANYFQYKINQQIQEKRVADLKESRDILLAPIGAIKQTVELILSLIQSDVVKNKSK